MSPRTSAALLCGAVGVLGAYMVVRAIDLFRTGKPTGAALGVGVLLLVGVGTRIVAVMALLLLLVFVAGVSQAWARGLSIDCGCFGGGGAVDPGHTAYVQEILRDTGFLVLAGWLILRPRTLFSIDSRYSGRT